MNQILIASLVALSLSACGTNTAGTSAKDAATKAPKNTYRYYSHTTPVNAKGSYEQINTARYSKMHLIQSSYLFQ